MNVVKKNPYYYILLLLIFLFFGKKLFIFGGNFIGGWDVEKYFFWHAHFIKEQFLAGNTPLWNPYYYSGHPFLANPQTFVFYPSTLLYILLSIPLAINLDTIFHVLLAAVGTYKYLLMIDQSKNSGLTAAIVYSLSGYFMNNIFVGHLTMIHTAALIPWIFYFIEKALKTEQFFFFIISGVVLGIQILGGEPQNSYYTSLFITLYFAIRIFYLNKESQGWKQIYFLGKLYLIVPVIAFGLSAIQIFPSYEFMTLCDRAAGTYEFATYGSFPPKNFFTFLVPDSGIADPDFIPQEFAGYFGVLSILIALVGGLFAAQRRYAVCFGILILFSVTIMLGHNTPFYQIYYKFIPGLSTFRIPARCIVIFIFSVSVLAGMGIHHLEGTSFRVKQYVLIMIAIVFLIIYLFAGVYRYNIPLGSKEILKAMGMLILSLCFFYAFFIFKHKKIIVWSVIAVIFVDFYLLYSHRLPVTNDNKLLKKHEYELLLDSDPGYYRINLPFDMWRGMVFKYANINGYTPIVLTKYFSYLHDMAGVPMDKNRRHRLSHDMYQPGMEFSSKIFGVKYAMSHTGSEYQMTDSHNVMPRAVLAEEIILLPDMKDQADYIKRTDFNPKQQVILESTPDGYQFPVPANRADSKRRNKVSITSYHPNEIRIKAIAGNDAYLVLSELYYPGWKAYVDLQEVEIQRADYLLRAIPLKAGTHEILFQYRPVAFLIGKIITIVTIVILSSAFIMNRHAIMNRFLSKSASRIAPP